MSLYVKFWESIYTAKFPDASVGTVLMGRGVPFSFLSYLGNHRTNSDHSNDIYK